MKLATKLIFIAALASIPTGCGPIDHEEASSGGLPAGAADAQTVQNVRERYSRAYPESRVGVVIETLSSKPFAAVGELPATSELRETQTVTFLDGRERILTTGTIVRILPDTIHVRYDPPRRGGRAPRRGDIMVFVPNGAQPL
ncbi:MAG: hypothetical protein QOE14_721 [Humisphaera sp.]|nr:hypothetical protein [Humisphaera sp.]